MVKKLVSAKDILAEKGFVLQKFDTDGFNNAVVGYFRSRGVSATLTVKAKRFVECSYLPDNGGFVNFSDEKHPVSQKLYKYAHRRQYYGWSIVGKAFNVAASRMPYEYRTKLLGVERIYFQTQRPSTITAMKKIASVGEYERIVRTQINLLTPKSVSISDLCTTDFDAIVNRIEAYNADEFLQIRLLAEFDEKCIWVDEPFCKNAVHMLAIMQGFVVKTRRKKGETYYTVSLL